MGFGPIHINFLEHIKFHPVSLSKFLDFTAGSRLLSSKLVAGKRKNGQLITRLVVLLVQLYQLGIVGLGQASFRGHVDDHADLALVLAEVGHLAVNVPGGELIDVVPLGLSQQSHWTHSGPVDQKQPCSRSSDHTGQEL